MRWYLSFLIVAAAGCRQDVAQEYGYIEPKVPSDIAHFVPSVRARGYDAFDARGGQIDQYEMYLRGHRAGFEEAARQFETNGRCDFHTIEDLPPLDDTAIAIRGYWDGYVAFKETIATVHQEQGRSPTAKPPGPQRDAP
jgi:hypothetical protein